MKKGFIRKLRGRWFRLIQSPYLVPVSTILFANIFLFSAILVHENNNDTRNKIVYDCYERNQMMVAQMEANLDLMLTSCFRQLEVTQDFENQSEKFLESFLKRNPCYEGLAIHTPGKSWTITGVFPQKDLSMKKGITETSTILPFGTQSDSLMLFKHNNDFATYYFCVNTRKLFTALLSEVSSFYNHQVWLISPNGNWLFHPEEDLTGFHFSMTEEEVREDSDNTLSTLAKQLTRSDEPGFKYLYFNSALHPTSHQSIAFYYPVSSPYMQGELVGKVMMVIPQKRVLKGINELYKRHYLAEGAILGGILLFGLIFAGQQQKTSSQLKSIVGEQDQILSSVLANSVDAIIVLDEEDSIQMWNRGAQLVFGYASDETLGHSIKMIAPPDIDADKELQWINREIKKKGYLRNYTTHRITKDGVRITVDETRTRFQSADGSTTGSTVIIKDETNRLELDQRMYNAEKLASIGLLASGVAHEINNPLAIILGFTDLLKEKFEKDSRICKDLEMIEENAIQAQKIVSDLLGFSRVSEGRAGEHFNIVESVNKVVDLIKTTKLAKNTDFALDLSDNLPEVRGDAREFQQVLLNLINNSIASFEKKDGHIKIRARFLEKRWNVLEIIDDGSGIPIEIQHNIFDPFFTTKEVGEGTGLGLSLCYGIVKKMGGAIIFDSHTKAESNDGSSGTKFIIRLPGYQEIVEEA